MIKLSRYSKLCIVSLLAFLIISLLVSSSIAGKNLVVTSPKNDGAGSLRHMIKTARPGDTITFDPSVFDPEEPARILLKTTLPDLGFGNLTIDGSNAGVIIDGKKVKVSDPLRNPAQGLMISSGGNVIRGLQIVNFEQCGIAFTPSGDDNLIGGDRSKGAGPTGQVNIISGNGRGIDFAGGSSNIVTGNYIGSDSTGSQGRPNNTGIFINAGTDNVIGPSNVIVYNRTAGITVQGPNSQRNTITRNRIHHNGVSGVVGIYLYYHGNKQVKRPIILEHDLSKGYVSGMSIPNSRVEIFSDRMRQGGVFEGSTQANEEGFFVLDLDRSSQGPHLTATATDPNGNTSAFSRPTYGEEASLRLQHANARPKKMLHSKPSTELEDNRLGQMTGVIRPELISKHGVKVRLHRQNRLGLKWHRLSIDYFDWREVEAAGAYSRFEVHPEQTQFLKGLVERNMKVVYNLLYWDPNIDHTKKSYSRFRNKEEVDRFLRYVRLIIENYGKYIDYYALLNEPNAAKGTQQYVEPEDYINLASEVIPLIKKLDPTAKIIVGEVTSFQGLGSWDYLTEILRSDLMKKVDGICWHPWWASPQYHEDYYRKMPKLAQKVVKIASQNGFDGKYITSEIHYRSPVTAIPEEEYTDYSFTAAVKYTMRQTVRFLGMKDFLVGLGTENDIRSPFMVNWIRNLSTLMSGVIPSTIPIELQVVESRDDGAGGISPGTGEQQEGLLPVKASEFIGPKRDKIIAIWKDGLAEKFDPGSKVRVTVPQVSSEVAYGIDVLNGYKQELKTKRVNGELVIPELLVKDYPIFLQLGETGS